MMTEKQCEHIHLLLFLILFNLSKSSLQINGNSNSNHNGVGYFWHLTDIIVHSTHNITSRTASACLNKHIESHGYYPERSASDRAFHHCRGHPEFLPVEHLVKSLKLVNERPVEFIVWSGSIKYGGAKGAAAAISPDDTSTYQFIEKFTAVLEKEFDPLLEIYPVIGNINWKPGHLVSSLWSKWIPPESLEHFIKGGYYTIEKKNTGLQLVLLNTNIYSNKSIPIPDTSDIDPYRQFRWLESVLINAERGFRNVCIVGDNPPNKYHNAFKSRYVSLVKQYSSVIRGQFFANSDKDTFRLIYDKPEFNMRPGYRRPLSYFLIAPTINIYLNWSLARYSKHSFGGYDISHSGVRLYKFDSSNGQVLDYMQYSYENHNTKSNGLGTSGSGIAHGKRPSTSTQWKVDYSFSSITNSSSISAVSLNHLANSFLAREDPCSVFDSFYEIVNRNMSIIDCIQCKEMEFCELTNLDSEETKRCQELLTHGNSAHVIAPGYLHVVIIASGFLRLLSL